MTPLRPNYEGQRRNCRIYDAQSGMCKASSVPCDSVLNEMCSVFMRAYALGYNDKTADDAIKPGCDFCRGDYPIISGVATALNMSSKNCRANFCPNCGKLLASAAPQKK